MDRDPQQQITLSRRKRYAIAAGVTLVIVLSPLRENFRDRPNDGFPLSYFPMFTKERGSQTKITHPVGFTADGTEINLHYRLVGPGGMNQVRRQLNRLARQGKAEELCRKVAKRISASHKARYRNIVEVALVTDAYAYEQFFAGDRTFVKRIIRARQPVSRKDRK